MQFPTVRTAEHFASLVLSASTESEYRRVKGILAGKARINDKANATLEPQMSENVDCYARLALKASHLKLQEEALKMTDLAAEKNLPLTQTALHAWARSCWFFSANLTSNRAFADIPDAFQRLRNLHSKVWKQIKPTCNGYG